MKTVRAILLALLAVVPIPAGAGAFSDLVMAPGVLGDPAEGIIARYALTRRLPDPPEGATPAEAAPSAVAEGELVVLAVAGEGGKQLVLQRREDGSPLPEIAFSADGPNPLLLFFLENVVRVMAAETGGSPFYIRNRIREALGTADLAPGEGAQTLLLQPFAEDPNRARMGDYGTLALSITFDPADPGRLIELKADTGAGAAGYTETLRLIAKE